MSKTSAVDVLRRIKAVMDARYRSTDPETSGAALTWEQARQFAPEIMAALEAEPSGE